MINRFICSSTRALDLSGEWRFQLDPTDVGEAENWPVKPLSDKMSLPGSVQESRKGDPVTVETHWVGDIFDRSWFTDPEFAAYREPGHIKIPFWLQPETVYTGAAWYQRDVTIPSEWLGRPVVLSLERPHWKSRVWIDGIEIGACASLGTPHEYVIGDLAPGPHLVTLCIDNRIIVDVGCNSHSVSDHTQGNWNGIVGAIQMSARGRAWVNEAQTYPDIASRSVRVVLEVGAADSTSGCATIEDQRGRKLAAQAFTVLATENNYLDLQFNLGPHAQLWDEFDPNLYRLQIEFEGGETHETTFGLREVGIEGAQITINGRPVFFRGNLECAIFPLTGYPPTDKESWSRILRIAKDHGLNHIRFHSWCPPRAAFDAADELGMYYLVEVSSWGAPGDSEGLGDWIYWEADRMLREYGNHPSFILMGYGNEPSGENMNAFLSRFVSHYRERDPRRLYTSGAAWPQLPENDFHIAHEPRIQHWEEGLNSRINASPPETTTDYSEFIEARGKPVISHEIGQWCCYPNFAEMRKYTGHLKPRNFEILWDRLVQSGLADQAEALFRASGKLQVLCYKEEIESALRTPGMAGFQLLDLHDFPGQGTALVGVLDPFWDSKGHVTAEEFRGFCSPTVALIRLEKRVFVRGEPIRFDFDLSYFGPTDLYGVNAIIQLHGKDGLVEQEAQFALQQLRTGSLTAVTDIEWATSDLDAPAKYRIAVKLPNFGFQNEWDIWVYPERHEPFQSDPFLETSDLEEAIRAAESGARVLLCLDPKRVQNDSRRPVQFGFSTIFWNTAWTNQQAPTTLGLLLDPAHPLFAEFPTEEHTNWQWWTVIKRSQPMILSEFDLAFRPVVQVIDDWCEARKLGIVIEGRLGTGSILVTSIDWSDAESDPVCRQLLYSIRRYLRSAAFVPKTALSAGEIHGLIGE